MKTGIRSGMSHKTQYKAYKDKGSWRKNKIKKLERRVLANPNDVGAEEALDKFMKTTTKIYGRGKPGNKGWFHPQEIQLLKQLKNDGCPEDKLINDKLGRLRAVYTDTRPSAIRTEGTTPPRETMADKLYNVGLINEKRKNAVNARMGRIRPR